MIRLNCQCGKGVKLPADRVGQALACPHCKRPVRVIASMAASQPSHVDSLFVIESGPDRVGEQVFLGGGQAIKIGKSEEAELRLRAPSVSRYHSRLVPGQYGWRVEDNNSTNGLYVNGKRAKGHNLLDGDLVRVGEYELRYISEQAAAQRGKNQADETAITRAQEEQLTFLDDVAGGQTMAVPPPIPVAGGGKSRQQPPPKKPTKAEEDDEPLQFADDEWEGVVPTPKRQSGQTCPRCNTPLPPEARICVNCGTDLRSGKALRIQTDGEPITGPAPSISAYVKDCMWSLAFVADLGSLLSYIFIAILAMLLVPLTAVPVVGGRISCFRLLGVIIVCGYLCAYMFNVVLGAANGEKELPKITLTGGWWDDIFAPFFKYIATWIVALTPAIVYGVWLGGSAFASLASGGSAFSDLQIIIFQFLLWLGVVAWPFAMLAVAVGGFDAFMRPDLIVYTIFRTLVPYILTCVMTALAFGSSYAIEILLATRLGAGGNLMVAQAIGWIVSVYFWIVAMRVIGLYYHHFKKLFAWSWG